MTDCRTPPRRAALPARARRPARVYLMAGIPPVLPAVYVPRVHLAVWCQHCRRPHWHGAGDHLGDGDGHRVAHCGSPDSRYDSTGYVLLEVPISHPDVADLVQHLRRRSVGAPPADRSLPEASP